MTGSLRGDKKTNGEITWQEAQRLLCGAARPTGVSMCAVGDSLNRILAEDLISPVNQPPFRRSAMHNNGNSEMDENMNIFEKAEGMMDGEAAPAPDEMIALFPDADLILMEGCKGSSYPKLEVVRKGNSCESVSTREGLMAIVTDLPEELIICDGQIPLLDLNDPERVAEFILNESLRQRGG